MQDFDHHSYAVIIVAAGSGQRFEGKLPKQYRALAEKPILLWSYEAFLNHPMIDNIVIVVHSDHRYYFDNKIADHIDKNTKVVTGGNTRLNSVHQGLKALQSVNPEFVLVHDAARPFVSERMISRVCRELPKLEAIIPTIPVIDTLKSTNENMISGSVDREKIRNAQTPQGFKYQTLYKLYSRNTDLNVTDDSILFERAGETVYFVDGERGNFKLTYPEDLDLAHFILSKQNDQEDI